MLACQEKRFMTQFNDDEAKQLNKNIRKISNSLRQELKTLEKKINIYIHSDFFDSDDDLLLQIKENISQNLLSELNLFSKKFKINQEIDSQKCKELFLEEEDDNIHEMNDISTSNSDINENISNKNGDHNFLMQEEPDLILVKRDNELKADRQSQIGSGDRSEKIRTYNYPQNRITDHRIGLTLYNLDRVSDTGDIEEIIQGLRADAQAKYLVNME